MEKLERYFKKILGIAMQVALSPFVAVMILALFSNTILNNKYSQTYVLNFLNDRIKAVGTFELDFKKINVNLMALRVDFESLNLKSSTTGETLLKLEKGSTGISIVSLALARFQMSNITIDSLYLNHEKILENIKQTSTKSNESFSWPPDFPVPVERIKIARLSTEIDAYYQDDDAKIDVKNAKIDMLMYSWNSINLKLSIPEFSYISDTVVLANNTAIDSELNWNGRSIAIVGANLENKSLKLSTNGNIDLVRDNKLLSPIKIYTSSTGTGNLSALGTFLDFEQTSGNVKLSANTEVEIPQDTSKAKFMTKGLATLEDAWLYGYSLLDSKVQFDVNTDRIRFSDIELTENGKSYGHAAGQVSFDSATDYSFNIQPKSLPLSKLLDILKVDFKAFDFDLSSDELELKGKGTPFTMTLKGRSDLNKMRFPQFLDESLAQDKIPSCKVDIDVKINSDKMQFLNNLGQCQNQSTVTLNGPIYFSNRGIDLDVGFHATNLDIFTGWAQYPLEGSGDISTKVIGPWSAIEIKNEFSLQNAKLKKIPLNNLSATTIVDIKRNLVSWRNLLSESDTTKLESEKGFVHLNNLDFAAEIKAQNLKDTFLTSILDIVDIKTEFTTEISSWEGSISGKVPTPGAWTGTGKIELANIKLGSETLLNQCRLEYDLAGKLQKINKIACQLETTKISGNAAINLTSKHDGSLSKIGISDSDEITLDLTTVGLMGINQGGKSRSDLANLPFVKKTLESLELDSDIEGKISLRGTVGHPIGGGELKLINMTFRGSPVPVIDSRFTLDRGNFDIVASCGGRSTDIRFVLSAFAPNIPYKLRIIANQMDLRWLLPKTFYQNPTNYLLVSGFLDMEGKFSEFFNSKGSLELKNVKAALTDVEGKTVRFNTSPNETLILKDQTLSVKSGRPLQFSSTDIKIELDPIMGKLPYNLDLNAKGEFGLNLAKLFSPALETTSGYISFESSLTGNISAPALSLTLKSSKNSNSNVSFGLKELRPAFSDVEFRATVNSTGLRIERFSARKGSGIVKAEGSISFDAQESSGLNISFKEASLIRSIPYLKDFDAILSGNILIKSLSIPTSISGDIEIVRARLNREFDIRNEIISALRNAKFDVKESRTKESAKLDFHLHSDDGISIVNRNMNLILACDLKISGTDIDPKMLGLIEVKQGKFVYRTDYKISKGLISFDPSQGVDPTLDISANADIDKRRVDVEVTGKGSSPLISISVDPPTKDDGSVVTETDAVLLVTTGSLPKSGRGLADSNLKSGGLNIIAGQFEKPVERLFDMTGQKIVKGVYFDTYPSNSPTNTGSPVFRANASLQIVDDLDFIIQADQQQSGFSAEYPIDPNVNSSVNYSKQKSQESFQTKDDEYDAGFDLRFRFQFP